MARPNMHYILMNLSAFGMDNNNDVFLPTDEPHGQIECTGLGCCSSPHCGPLKQARDQRSNVELLRCCVAPRSAVGEVGVA